MVRPVPAISAVGLCVFLVGFLVSVAYQSHLAIGITGGILLLLGVFVVITSFDLDERSTLKLNYLGTFLLFLGGTMFGALALEVGEAPALIIYLGVLMMFFCFLGLFAIIGAFLRDLTRSHPYTQLSMD